MADTAATPDRSRRKHPAWRRIAAPAILLALAAIRGAPSAGARSRAATTDAGAGPFRQLPGWSADNVAAVLPAFLKSCARLASQPAGTPLDPAATEGKFGRVGDWQGLCEAARALPAGDDAKARAFFEANFTPALAGNSGDSRGHFTGYYEPELVASRQRGGAFQTPVYRRPADLTRGRPYLSRAQIDDGALNGKGLELLWLKSPDDLYVLQTQGSGRVRLTDGTVERLVYDANNGLPPVNIEKLLFDSGAIPPAQFSQASIRAWMRSHPVEAEALRRKNPEYVFFREHNGDGPIGAEGAVLTPERSLAVDHRFVPLGMPLWLAAHDKYRPVAVNRLVVAQDIGDGIQGPVRGDYFWGHGDEAVRRGGDFYASGQYYLLLPKIRRRPPARRALAPPAPQCPARPLAGRLAVLPDRLAVDEDMGDARRRLHRLGEGGAVDHRLRIEDAEIGIGARRDDAAPLEPEPRRRDARHLAHRGFEIEEAELTAVMAEDARERAPEARMRVAVVRQPVRSDHRRREGEDALHIGLVHHEIDRAGGLQPLGRLDEPDTPFGGDLGELAPGAVGPRLRPGDQHLQRILDALDPKHGRRGDIGVDVEPDLLPRHRRLDLRQGLAGAAEIGDAGGLVVRDHDRDARVPSDVETLVEAVEHVLGLVAHMRRVERAGGLRGGGRAP